MKNLSLPTKIFPVLRTATRNLVSIATHFKNILSLVTEISDFSNRRIQLLRTMNRGGGETSCIIHSLVAFEEKILASCSSPIKESAYDAQICSVLSEKVLKKICARMHNHKKTYITEKYAPASKEVCFVPGLEVW